jgi:glycosyltransferase involved in cell wall biosynthesis
VIIGGTQREIEERRSRLREQGIAESVTFLGKIPPDELPDYLGAADVLLSPRIAGKNTPLKLLDYLKAARAIVATDGEANRLILDENTAVLAEPQADAFAAGIVRALEDDALRERLAAEGRKLIREVYNFDEFKRRLSECYSALP